MIEVSSFGSSKAKQYRLVNASGMQVTLTNFGARIVAIAVPVEEDGSLRNITLSASSDEAYQQTDVYPGSTIVPVAGRISGAKTVINGKEYSFTENEPGRTLHGGYHTANEQYWDTDIDEKTNSVSFSLTLEDGFNGFPGAVHVKARYRLTSENALEVSYTAQSDKDTIFNPTNHVYFNLTGDTKRDVGSHYVRIQAEKYAPLGEDNLPLGSLESVEGTPFDFRNGAYFEQGFLLDHPQTQLTKGYDHPWLLDSVAEPVEIISPDKKVRLSLATNQPAVVIYTYNFPCEELASYHGAFSLECQGLPNACNIEDFGSILLEKGQTYQHLSVYKCSW